MGTMLLVVQNDAEVPPGRYGELLDLAGCNWQLVHLYDGEPCPALDQVRGVMVLGGAMGTDDTADFPFLVRVKALIKETLDRRLPYLGICLGGQLLAQAAGARVMSGQWGEKGTLGVELTASGGGDPLFHGIPAHFTTFQWHNDSFAIPSNGTLLASSPVCPHQAFRVGENAYGVQFHPEVNRAIVECWSRETPDTTSLVSDFLDMEQPYRLAGDRLLQNFLRLSGFI